MTKYIQLHHLPKYVHYSEEDEGFIAIVPTLPGLSSFGETEIEALQELNVAVQAYLETTKERNPHILEIDD